MKMILFAIYACFNALFLRLHIVEFRFHFRNMHAPDCVGKLEFTVGSRINFRNMLSCDNHKMRLYTSTSSCCFCCWISRYNGTCCLTPTNNRQCLRCLSAQCQQKKLEREKSWGRRGKPGKGEKISALPKTNSINVEAA